MTVQIKELHTLASISAAYAGRDRALLYTRGMGIDPLKSVSLALESLSRAGSAAPPSVVMEQLFQILREQDVTPLLCDEDGARLISAPPMNRTHVVARDVDPLSLSGALAAFFRNVFRKPGQKPGGGA